MGQGSLSRIEAPGLKAVAPEGLPGVGAARVESEGWGTLAGKLGRNPGTLEARDPPSRRKVDFPARAFREVTPPLG